MLHLIPAPLHRLLYRWAHRARKRWLRLRGGTVRGCSIIACDGEGRVLLVRHSYGSGLWSLPGGGLGRSEDPLAGAYREFAEELGCGLVGLRHVATLDETYHGARHEAYVVTGLVDGTPRPDRREIVEARFFALDELPQDKVRVVAERLALLR
jgi:ADP-ribose pyrophosphatase YjhB (NUDIX family)